MTFVAVVIMVAAGTVSAALMAWTSIYFSHASTYYVGGVEDNDTNAILSKDVGPYHTDVENFHLDDDETNFRRKEKIKEVNKLILISPQTSISLVRHTYKQHKTYKQSTHSYSFEG